MKYPAHDFDLTAKWRFSARIANCTALVGFATKDNIDDVVRRFHAKIIRAVSKGHTKRQKDELRHGILEKILMDFYQGVKALSDDEETDDQEDARSEVIEMTIFFVVRYIECTKAIGKPFEWTLDTTRNIEVEFADKHDPDDTLGSYGIPKINILAQSIAREVQLPDLPRFDIWEDGI